MQRQGSRTLAAALALAGLACDFQKDPDPGPAAIAPIRFVTV